MQKPTPPLPPDDEVPKHRKTGPRPYGCVKGKGEPCDFGPWEEGNYGSLPLLVRRCRMCRRPRRIFLQKFIWDYSTLPATRLEGYAPGYCREDYFSGEW